IQSTWDPENWKYCPSKENPADLLTRGLSCGDLGSSELWWNGPKWLTSPVEEHPAQSFSKEEPDDCKKERRATHSCTSVLTKPVLIVDPNLYSTWLKLIRVTVYVLKAVRLFKAKTVSTVTELSSEELKQAEMYCHRTVQREVYSEDYKTLKEGKQLTSSSRLLRLDPYYDEKDQVLRVGGRLQFADLPEENKHQIILPHGHIVVQRLVRDLHIQLLHAGPETVLSTLRNKVWITQGRREVKGIIRKCVACQKLRVGPCGQKMGPLPKERVQCSPSFTNVGIDFAGPLYVKEGTSTKKAYVCVFTCASSCMVHLELTNSLTTDEFLQALSRMTSRRGLCSTIWSDNAKTFKAASKEIQNFYGNPAKKSNATWSKLDQDRIQSELSSKGITWKYITERSPWRGGWWERMCRAVKEPLCKVLGKALLSFSELNTLLIKVEAVINSRPLTAVSDDHRDLSPITPAHLTIGRALESLPSPTKDDLESSTKGTVTRYLYLQRLLNHYWKRWEKEYLHNLTTRVKWKTTEPPVQVGDIVLVSEDNVSRLKWPLGRVEK
ncbi:uncharacterized protein LOC116296171, partial [Actinia tenebrosa]|uniref:Uncharacterized protein LOC116296171 n=1 Tax=Actinia tenebrosa TaxID=6105 RepID=A0A6P8HXD6_ACTTE